MGRDNNAWSVLFSFLFIFVTQVNAELCPDTDNVYCDYGQYCCGGSLCCTDYDGGYYSYGFWNIWYFWFIVFFILMTCCGGCGFYRRRQAYMNGNRSTIIAGPGTIIPPPRGGTIPTGAYPAQPISTGPQSYYQGPPTYDEAVNKPYMYPKTEPYGQPPVMPINGATPYPQANPAYPPTSPNPAYPPAAPNPAYPQAAPNPAYPPTSPNAAYPPTTGYPYPATTDTPSNPTATPMPEPPPYMETASNATQASAPVDPVAS
ncbi:extensin-like [Asterias rubens]|uniref:extensin-like n=1 Tax=Asterias rubens TaxID=7604 RepID=UPI00145574EC|nr:extensin-like [Asterias rubens]